MGSLRLLSYNVRSLRDDRHAVAAVVRTCRPDVVCVQEAPRFLCWRRKARWLADATGLAVVTGGRPAAAMLVLARPDLPVRWRRDVLLSPKPGLHQRGLAMAVLGTGSGDVGFVSLHLDLDPAARLASAGEVLAAVNALPPAPVPWVLAGDVNEEADGPAWRRLARSRPDAYPQAPTGEALTFSSADPRRRIDAAFVDPRLQVVECGVPTSLPGLPDLTRASDHRPLLVVLNRR